MTSGIEGASSTTKIAAGIAVFVVSWITQATMGDSSMFSMSYVDQGFIQGLLVNLTFWPGWLFTFLLIGAGVMEIIDGDGTSDFDSRSEEAE